MDEKEQKQIDNMAIALSKLMGAKVVHQDAFDAVNTQNKDLLEKTKDLTRMRNELWKTKCKLHAFVRYHGKWKPVTKKIEERLKLLTHRDVYIDFEKYSADLSRNLKEAYQCYVSNLNMASYVMILRTIELAVNELYDAQNEVQIDSKGKKVFVTAGYKLNWVRTEGMIKGADYTLAKAFIESRNESVHEIFEPSDNQIISAFETVLKLIDQLPNQG